MDLATGPFTRLLDGYFLMWTGKKLMFLEDEDLTTKLFLEKQNYFFGRGGGRGRGSASAALLDR